MTENMNENPVENKEQTKWNDGNKKTLKFMALCASAFLGGFAAIFALSSIMTLAHRPHPPKPVAPLAIDRIYIPEEFFDEDTAPNFEPPRPVPPKAHPVHKKPIVKVLETEDELKIKIDLKRFNDNENNLKVDIKPNKIKISGVAEIKTKDEQSSFSYLKEFTLPRRIDVNDVTKNRIGNSYIITLPYKD